MSQDLIEGREKGKERNQIDDMLLQSRAMSSKITPESKPILNEVQMKNQASPLTHSLPLSTKR